MGVFGRALVLGFTVAVCAPGTTSAASINGLELTDDDYQCPIGVVAPSCGLFTIAPDDPLLLSSLSIGFQDQSDVLLIQFTLPTDSYFSVTTTPFNTSELEGPLLGVFDTVSGDVVTAGDIKALGEEISPAAPSPEFTGFVLAQGTYFLALLSPTNFFGGAPLESVFATFNNDSFPAPCTEAGCSFSLSMSVEPVPEPGTLTLIAGGALTGLIHRRRSKKRNRSKSVSRLG